jgi:hypothetical protein
MVAIVSDEAGTDARPSKIRWTIFLLLLLMLAAPI